MCPLPGWDRDCMAMVINVAVSCPAAGKTIIWSRMPNSPSEPGQVFNFSIIERKSSVLGPLGKNSKTV